MQFRAVKGMNDILPGDSSRWHRLESTFREIAALHGFGEVRTPLMEPTELFVRSIGESTDVVGKEMYTLERGKKSLTVRPEGTAGAARAYVEHTVYAREPVTRWFYIGPMFRAEKPARGRYRQFFQAGCEIYGDPGPACDAELIDMLCVFFRRLGVPDVRVAINSIGGAGTRAAYRERLVSYLTPHAGSLSADSQRRLETNPLRVLDSKAPADQEIVAGAPSILDVLADADREHFDEFQAQLTALGTPFDVEPGLVRGLDYYNRTLFEVRSNAGDLGAQNTIAGGGRYDGMVKSLGGPDTPAIGFAMGLERILLALGDADEPTVALTVVVPIGVAATRRALSVAQQLRQAGLVADCDGRDKSMKAKLRRANSLGARACIVIGEDELGRGVVQLKDFQGGSQVEVATQDVAQAVSKLLDGASA